MKDFVNTMQCVFAAAGGFLGWFLGGVDGFLYALMVFVIVDYVTGIMVAIIEKKLSSEVGFRGIFKKVLIFSMVAIGNILDTHIIRSGNIDVVVTIKTEMLARDWTQFLEFMKLCDKKKVDVVCSREGADAAAQYQRIQEFLQNYVEGDRTDES